MTCLRWVASTNIAAACLSLPRKIDAGLCWSISFRAASREVKILECVLNLFRLDVSQFVLVFGKRTIIKSLQKIHKTSKPHKMKLFTEASEVVSLPVTHLKPCGIESGGACNACMQQMTLTDKTF